MECEINSDEQKTLVSALQASLQARGGVELFETHISWVLVAGDEAYKLKKAVRFDFADFSTLELRRHLCEEELRLNRRLAPHLYLGVLPVSGTPARPLLGDASAPIEYVVGMRAFPQQALWSWRIEAGLLGGAEVDDLARQLSAFHQANQQAPRTSSWGTPAALSQAFEQNMDALLQLVRGQQHEQAVALRDWRGQAMPVLWPLFAARKAGGAIRECHGDLHCANILTLDGHVAAFDCIEFDPALRWIDVAHELAFTCMDLRQRGRVALAARLLDRYLEAGGAYEGVAVFEYYVVLCALVRAKVELLRAGQVEPVAAARHRANASALLATATAAARVEAPSIIVMHGLSGSGKSALAAQLAELLPAVRLRSDVERKRMHGLALHARPDADAKARMYGQAASSAVYNRLGELAEILVRAGKTALIDACSLKRRERDAFRALGARLGVPVRLVSVRASEATLRQRIRERSARGGDPSDADERVLELQLRVQEPLAPDEMADVLVVESDESLDLERVVQALVKRSS
ncbi:bifunctional aminoglycoside phosphotransferase/ATP-binding protein [Massilia horti]|nr:bifunctional aminoglycoside phosphotransferase/ATP-binding protein [Massilia horti]